MSQDNAIKELESRFPVFVDSFINKIVKEDEVDQVGADRIRAMLNYNCVGGKYFRGASTVTFARMLCDANGSSFADIEERAYALGWAVEILQAYFLIADDMMDKSHTRRGQVCWYLRPEVQNDAINDCFITDSFLHHIIETYSENDSQYVILTKLFHDVKLKTELGQMIDLLSQPQGRKGADILETFNIDVHSRIVKYKTAYYTFYLPIVAAFVICGNNDKKTHAAIEKVCLEIGEKFQIQDDYLDCFQDPKILGKIGTDIQDHKCSWLVVQALERVNPEQKKVLVENYGIDTPEAIQRIKDLYNELDLTAVYNKQEEDSYNRLQAILAESKQYFNPSIFDGIIARVHNRQK